MAPGRTGLGAVGFFVRVRVCVHVWGEQVVGTGLATTELPSQPVRVNPWSQLWRAVCVTAIGWNLSGPLFAGSAKMLFHCTSVKIEPAIVKALGDHRLSFNFSNTDTENGELAFLDEPGVDPVTGDSVMQNSAFKLTAPGFGVPIEGEIYFETPQLDTNRNGVDDIFEVDLAQPSTSKKGFLTFVSIADETVNGTVVAQWERAAGSTRGTVQLKISFPGYQQTFLHPFEVFEYAGSLNYQRTGTNVTASVDLLRQGAVGALSGAWPLHIADADSLRQDGGAWVAGKPELKFEATSLDGGVPIYDVLRGGLNTNYFGALQYLHGSPVDPVPLDYALWNFDIFDPNDADHDRIPDLTDPDFTGGTPPLTVPKITIVLEAVAPRLHLTGGTNTDYVIEKSDSLGPVVWSPISTNRPTAIGGIDVPLPTKGANGLRFWRARSL